MPINLFSPSWDIADSYGRVANELAKGLEQQGMYVNYFGSDAPDKPIKFSFGGIFMGYPISIAKWGDFGSFGKSVSLSMFESTELPPGWEESLNKCDAAIVPTTWLVDVYRNSGVTVPVEVVPLGVSEKFEYKPRTENDKFRFLAIGDGGARKACHFAMFAFIMAFGDDPSVELVIKSRKAPRVPFSNPNIRFINEDYSDERMNELYQSVDMMVFPSCGEGFGLPPLEFTKTGGIVAATNWSGMQDYIAEIGVPISHSMVKAWMNNQNLAGVGEWANINLDELAKVMKDFRSMSVEERNKWGKRSSDYVNRNYRWSDFAKRVYEIWDGLNADSRSA